MTNPDAGPQALVTRPWQRAARTIFQGAVAFCVLAPFIAQAAGIDPETVGWAAGGLAVAAGVSRVMALPQVEKFLRDYVPWLAAGQSNEGPVE